MVRSIRAAAGVAGVVIAGVAACAGVLSERTALADGLVRADSPPDVRSLLTEADSGVRSIRSVTYSARRIGTGAIAMSTPTVRGSVTIEDFTPGDPARWTFAFRGTSTGPDGREADFTSVNRGGTVVAVRGATKQVLEGRSADAGEVLADGGEWLISWLRHWDRLVSGPVLRDGTAEAAWLGRRGVGESLCDVIKIDYPGSENPSASWLYLSPADRLPRRVDVQAIVNGEIGTAILQLDDVQVNQAVDPGRYRWSLPAGFEAGRLIAKGTAEAAEPEPTIVAAGREAPAFSLRDPENNEVTLAGLKGSVVLIDFWATWCGPCIRAMPALQKIHEDFKDRGVKVYGINTWENDNADPVKFKKDKGLTYGLLLKGDKVAEAYGVGGIPAFFVISKTGKVLYSNSGFGGGVDKAIREAIEKGLKE